MSKVVLSFIFTMLCHGLQVDIKNACPRSEKFCIRIELKSNQSYELDRNLTYPHHKVTFSGSRLYSIPGNLFYAFPNVEFLTMTRCHLQSLDEADFMGAKNLKRLELWKNRIGSIQQGSLFSGARNLEYLDLSSNQIRQLHPDSFRGLRKLKKLFLFRNEIRILPPAIFRDLIALETIHLEDNLIEALHEDVFATNQRLGIVRIRQNRLKVVPPTIFVSLRNLYWLDLSHNRFDEIQTSTLDTLYINDGSVKGCSVNGKIRNLYAGNNQIRSLIIRDLAATQEIHVSNNELYNFAGLTNAQHLVKLDISQNPLTVLSGHDFENMTDLFYLNLSSTNLQTLSTGLFVRQSNLAILDLSRNSLTSLDADILDPLKNLRELHLNHNRLEELPYSNLRDMLPALKKLGLIGNDWKCPYLRDLVEYMDRNGISVADHVYNEDFQGTRNIGGINCTIF